MPFRPKIILLHPKAAPYIQEGTASHRALTQFIKDPLPGCHEEKIEAPVLAFTIRGNQVARFVIVPDPCNKEVGLLIKDLSDHKYNKINRQSKSWFDTQIEKTKRAAIELPEVEEKEESAELIPIAEAPHMEFYDQQYILLSQLQQTAKNSALPQIISGAPGSGKSTVLISKLKDSLLKDLAKEPPEKKKYLVLTESEGLLEELEAEWEALCEAKGLSDCRVDFKTPAQLHQEGLGEKPPKAAGLKEFKAWYVTCVKESIEESKNNKTAATQQRHQNLMIFFLEQECLYAEWRAMSGYSDLITYNTKVPDSFYPSPHLRKFIWNLKKEYLKTKPNDYSFKTIPNLESYDICLVDEAHDLSRQQLKSFGPNTLFCIGDHQSLFDTESIIPFIKSIYWDIDENINVQHNALSSSFRCAEHIIAFANFLLMLKYFCIGGKKFRCKHAIDFVESASGMGEGGVIWVENESELQKLVQNTHDFGLVVITPPAFFEEAEKLFGKGKVLTIKQSKGLQYKSVLLYKIEQKDLKLVDDSMSQFTPQATEPCSMPTMLQGLIFNGPFVATTRAQKNLYVYLPLPKDKPSRHLIKQLRAFILETFKKENKAKDKYEHQASTLDELEAIQEKLILSGNLSQAAALFEKFEELAEVKSESPAPPTSPDLTNLHLNEIIKKLLDPEGIAFFSQENDQQESVMDVLISRQKKRLVAALKAVPNTCKATPEQIACFIGITEKFKTRLGKLLKPLEDFIKEQLEENHKQLVARNTEAVELFYRMKNLVNDQEKIELAIREAYLVIIDDLHKKGADFNKFSFSVKNKPFPIIAFAILMGREEILPSLLSAGADINADSPEGTLLYASYQKWKWFPGDKVIYERIGLYLDWGADPNHIDPIDGNTRNLITSAIHDNELKIVKLFLRKKEDLIFKNKTMLLYAVLNKNKQLLKILLKSLVLIPHPFIFKGSEWIRVVEKYQKEQVHKLQTYIGMDLEQKTSIELHKVAEILGFSELQQILLEHGERACAKFDQSDPLAFKLFLLYAEFPTKKPITDHLIKNKHVLSSVVKDICKKPQDKQALLEKVNQIKAAQLDSLVQVIEQAMKDCPEEKQLPLVNLNSTPSQNKASTIKTIEETLQIKQWIMQAKKGNKEALLALLLHPDSINIFYTNRESMPGLDNKSESLVSLFHYLCTKKNLEKDLEQVILKLTKGTLSDPLNMKNVRNNFFKLLVHAVTVEELHPSFVEDMIVYASDLDLMHLLVKYPPLKEALMSAILLKAVMSGKEELCALAINNIKEVSKLSTIHSIQSKKQWLYLLQYIPERDQPKMQLYLSPYKDEDKITLTPFQIAKILQFHRLTELFIMKQNLLHKNSVLSAPKLSDSNKASSAENSLQL